MDNKELNNILNKMKREEVNEYLIDIFDRYGGLLDEFKGRYASYFPVSSRKEYRRRISDSIQACYGRDGYISYRETGEYTFRMHFFVRESEKLLEDKKYEACFDIIEGIFDFMPFEKIDDSDGSTWEVSDSCLGVMEELIGHTLVDDLDLSYRILEFVLGEIKKCNLSNYGVEIHSLLLYFIDEKFHLEEIEGVLKSYIKNHEDKYLCKYYQEYLEKIKEVRNS